jgi:hypothetical protein
MRHLIPALALPLVMAACAAGGNGPPAVARNVITSEQIQETSLSVAYDVVQRLRPEWLRSRGPTSIGHTTAEWPIVYVNSGRHGDLDTLRTMAVVDVREIRFLSGPEATQRFGTGVSGGVIQVLLR